MNYDMTKKRKENELIWSQLQWLCQTKPQHLKLITQTDIVPTTLNTRHTIITN